MRLVTASCDLESFDEFLYQVGTSLIYAQGDTAFDTTVYKRGRASLKVPPFSSFTFDIGKGCGTQKWYLKTWFRASADGVILSVLDRTSVMVQFVLTDGQIYAWVGRNIFSSGLDDAIPTEVFLDYDVWYELQIMVLHEKAFGIIEVYANGNGIRLTRQDRDRSEKTAACWSCPWGSVWSFTDMGPFGCALTADCPCDAYDDPCWDRLQTATGSTDNWAGRVFRFGDLSSGGGPMWYDNVFLNSGLMDADDPDNAGHIPLGRMLTVLKPNGEGAFSQFTPDGGVPNWQNVDEVPVSTAGRNVAGSAGLIDLYEVESASALIG